MHRSLCQAKNPARIRPGSLELNTKFTRMKLDVTILSGFNLCLRILPGQNMPYTAFSDQTRLIRGELPEIVAHLKQRPDDASLLVFDDSTGRCVDLDLRGTLEEALARLPQAEPSIALKAGPGRPRLGVVAREITLLPRHWEWLATQPGGASVALRKLVETASRANRARDLARSALEACHSFMSIMAGDRPGFEEAARALFAGDFTRVPDFMADWPVDVRQHAEDLLHEAQNNAYEAREG
jgi:hypothetical protein